MFIASALALRKWGGEEMGCALVGWGLLREDREGVGNTGDCHGSWLVHQGWIGSVGTFRLFF